ncbi:RHS repeat protein, partial [Luteimonas sp. XNQY3]|nr:RHS repeat protein [Luteimonas sp. XNQY3]
MVSAAGWITRVTDENGFATNYTYDAMGRLASVAYPTGDSTTWNTTTQVFQPVASAEYGIPAGHWRQTVSTGTGRRISYFDALWRPLLV